MTREELERLRRTQAGQETDNPSTADAVPLPLHRGGVGAVQTGNPMEYVGRQTGGMRGLLSPSQSAGADSSPSRESQDGRALAMGEAGGVPSSDGIAGAEPLMPRMQVIGENQLREFDKILRQYKAGKSNLERRIIDNEQWWKLRHSDGMPDTSAWDADKSAWLANVIMTKHADAMDAYPTCTVLPHAADDQKEAQKLSSIVPAVLRQTNFEKTYSDVWWQKLKSGTGCYKVTWDKNKLGGLGDISIKRVNLLNIFWEPGIENIQDSRYVFHVELRDKDRLIEEYPQLDDKVLSGLQETVAKFIYDDAVRTDDKALVIDCYYKKRGRLHLCKYVSSTVLYATENGDLAEAGLYDHGEYPFVLDPLFPIEGSCCGYGYIDYGKTTQHYIDKLSGAIMKNALAASVPRWFIRDDGSFNEAEYADFTKSFVHTSANLGKDSIAQIKADPLSGIYLNVLDSRITELKETLGNRDASTGGVTASVTSAAGIASLQEAAGKLSRDAEKASYRVFEQLVYMVIELIRQFYDTPRTFRITGEAGQQEFTQYDNTGIKAQSQGMDFGMDMGSRVPQFDLDVQAQKENPYTKESYNELAVQLYQMGVFNPEMANQALMMLDLMEFKGKEELVQKIQQQNQFMQMVQQAMMILQQKALAPGMAPGMAAPGGAPAPGGSAPQGEVTGAADKNPANHPSPNKARAQSRAASQPR